MNSPIGPDFAALKITRVGEGLGVVLPPELLAELELVAGDELRLVRSPEGYRLQKTSPDFERQMALARKIMAERSELLRALAK
jgi:putative addiction module antidote